MSSWVVPAGGIGSANFTNTGLGYDGTNLLIGDFTNGRIVVATKAGAYVSEIVLAGAPASSVQGVAYDTSDGSYWVCHRSGTPNAGSIRRYNSSGTLLQTITPSAGQIGPNGLAYDAANDRLLTCWSDNVIRGYNAGTGALAETITLSGLPSGSGLDGVAVDFSSPSTLLWVTLDGDSTGVVEARAAYLGQITRSTGAASGLVVIPSSTEGLAFTSANDLYVCADQGFHLSATNGNRVWKLNKTTGQPTGVEAMQVASGSFALNTTTGKQVVQGLPFVPRFVLFFGGLATSGTTEVSSFGAADNQCRQWAMATRNNHGVNPTVCERIWSSLYSYATSSGAGAITVTAEFGSIMHDGFAMQITTDGSARTLHYLAIGGSSVDVRVGAFDLTTASGTQAVTGVGFQPKAVLFSAATDNTTEGISTTTTRYALGAMTSAAQWVMTEFGQGANTPSDEQGVARTDAALVRIGNALTTTMLAARSSLDSDGFTVNKSTPPGGTVRIGYVAMGGSGLQVAAGAFNQPSSTGNQAITGVGFQPKAELFISAGRVASTTPTAGSRTMAGFAVSSSNRRTYWTGAGDAVNPSQTARVVSETAALVHASPGSGGSTTVAVADFVSQDSDGFTVNWTTADATARQNFYMAFGEAVPTSLGPGDKFLKLKLLGYAGSVNDMLFDYYRDRGATANNLNEAEMEFLAAQGALATPLNNRRRQFYSSLGYTGSINDMEYQYWWNL